jgi:hypothetical protein
MAEEKMEHVISNEAVDAAAMVWAQATWLYNWEHLGDDDPEAAGDTYMMWLEIQLDAGKKLGDMTIDDLEKHIHQYELAWQDHGNVITGTTYIGEDLYNKATTAWAEIKWYIAHDASLDYAEDTATFESQAQESLHSYIEQAGGEQAFYDKLAKK